MTSDKNKDKDFSFEAVPQTARKAFWAMFFIMLGFTFFSSSMSVGAKLGNGLDLKGYVVSVLIGSVFLSVYTGFLAFIGCKSGLSFDQLAVQTFGQKGSYLPSLMIAITQIGWFGVGVAMFSAPAAEVLGISRVFLIAAAGFCMTLSAYFGIKGMEIISYISVPLIAVLGVYSMVTAVNGSNGLASLFAQSAGSLSIYQGISLTIGSFVAGGTTTPNFTRFASTKKSAVISTVIAFFLGNMLMLSFGAVGGALTGKDDIFYVMMAQGLIVPALVVLGANIWTTNDNTLYNAGLGLANITKIRKKPMVVVAGVVGTIASVWIYNNFVSWLSILNATLPPIGAVLIFDYFIVRHQKDESNENISAIRVGNVISVAAGSLCGMFIPVGVASINAMAVSVILCLILKMANKDRIK